AGAPGEAAGRGRRAAAHAGHRARHIAPVAAAGLDPATPGVGAARPPSLRAGVVKTWEVAIVGAGCSGLAMAIQLKKAGRHDFIVLEQAAEVGGTWRENPYPGCACDIPSHLYSFSFEPNPNWSRQYSPQHEIWDYLRHCAHKYRINRHIRFNTTMVSAEL